MATEFSLVMGKTESYIAKNMALLYDTVPSLACGRVRLVIKLDHGTY
jgi:hypothetical protein